MEIKTREIDNVVILDIDGEIDLYTAPELKNTIKQNIEAEKYYIIINLFKVGYIDSTGMGVLIRGLTDLRDHQGSLKIINVNLSIKKVFELTRLSSFFEIFDDENEAMKSFV